MRKVIVKNYELKIPCSLGVFSMEEQYLCNISISEELDQGLSFDMLI